jgi:hypothetical protein
MNTETPPDHEKFIKGVADGSLKYTIKPDVSLNIPDCYINKKAPPFYAISVSILLLTPFIAYPILAYKFKTVTILVGIPFYIGFYLLLVSVGKILKKSWFWSLFVTAISAFICIDSVVRTGLLSPLSIGMINILFIILLLYITSYIKNRSLYQCLVDYKETYDDAVKNNKILIMYKTTI